MISLVFCVIILFCPNFSSGSDFQVDDNSPRNTSDRTGSGRKQSRPKSAKAADKKKKAGDYYVI